MGMIPNNCIPVIPPPQQGWWPLQIRIDGVPLQLTSYPLYILGIPCHEGKMTCSWEGASGTEEWLKSPKRAWWPSLPSPSIKECHRFNLVEGFQWVITTALVKMVNSHLMHRRQHSIMDELLDSLDSLETLLEPLLVTQVCGMEFIKDLKWLWFTNLDLWVKKVNVCLGLRHYNKVP